MSANSSIYLEKQVPEVLGSTHLSIAVIGPDDKLRTSLVDTLNGCHEGEVSAFPSYPPSLDDLPHLLEQHHDIVMIELDSKPEYALEVMEGLCAGGVSTIMVYSQKTDPEQSDPDLLMQCMRVGAREFLSAPFTGTSLSEALVRASARRPPTRVVQKGKAALLVFCGAKGGAGVTALACNFALALARASAKKTILIDLDLPLGDTALHLGLTPEYSTLDALVNYERLDWNFLSKLLLTHSSGLRVLAAPGRISSKPATNEAIGRLLAVARSEFDFVVVDAGSKLDSGGPQVHLREATTLYLVTQSGIPELRNANRLISQYVSTDSPKLEIVLNRCESRGSRISDDDVSKALTRPANWKIPNDYNAFRKMQDTAAPVVSSDSYLSWQIDQMARVACGLPESPQKKKNFSLLGLGRGNATRVPAISDASGPQRLGLITGGHGAETDEATEEMEGMSTSDQEGEANHLSAQPLPPSQVSSRASMVYNGRGYRRAAEGNWQVASEQNSPEDYFSHIEWPVPEEITFGVPLTASQLCAASPTPGVFEYTPSEGLILPAGEHSIWATFIPEDRTKPVVQGSTRLKVARANPQICWPRPDAISYGTPLSEAQFNASASIPGKLEYFPDLGEILGVGTQTLLAVFTPVDSENYLTSQVEVPLVVTRAATTIEWTGPQSIAYGTALSERQLCAVASVPGACTYTPAAGMLLTAGTHTLRVEFTPEDAANHTASMAEVSIEVTKAVPEISWDSPEPIVYGTPLSSRQLNAVTSVPGTSVYLPGEGAILGAGRHMPVLVFTPADGENYSSAQLSVPLLVTQAETLITWDAPAQLEYGVKLREADLNAIASVPGTFEFDPPAGALLAEGSNVLRATFTPIDETNYRGATASVEVTVKAAPPVSLEWASPVSIVFGTPLSGAQLNSTASVSGVFSYSPSFGEVLAAGEHTLFVKFIPNDDHLPEANSNVQILVTKAKPATEWAPLSPIQFGTALNSAHLNAKASVPGRFIYQPPEGELPAAGQIQLRATFTATDSANFEQVQLENPLAISKGLPVVHWSKPGSIPYGTPLGDAQLNAEASMQGTYVYAPSRGTVLAPGVHTLSVRFIPGDDRNFATVQASASLLVREIGRSEEQEPPSGAKEESSSPSSLEEGDRAEETTLNAATDVSVSPADNSGSQTPPIVTVTGLLPSSTGESSAENDVKFKPEIRTYRGATYRRGPDGQWHLMAN